METIKIKYFDNEIDKIEKISKGDLIDSEGSARDRVCWGWTSWWYW